MRHLDERELFNTDEEFANFRGLLLQNKRSRYFYRSASAYTNYYGRAATVQKLIKTNSINTIIDLTGIKHRCRSDRFGREFCELLALAIERDGPYIIQCDAGKKRTGFACLVLEALSGTSYELLVWDYLTSYANNNGLCLDADTVKYLARAKVIPNLLYIADATSCCLDEINLASASRSYLLKHGLTTNQIRKLEEVLLR